ncbi:Hint domain-containing protein [Sulfitobacter geojensis]|uniref:Hint domain-containing protein n=1 Tax=Sulfitobacter geojensis TaxID=1342299 RepID=A0AAE3B4G5_9RHOB|nr:Hint domain-containing protein [Sulfitobacter geojensis]MBM1687946.1 Hint domain-containing protein [Sulfitobacter geojensis]MBM1692013.1 Hint domain-containing protein [Sulfitobacter geojensis]MBM1704179.1 Hint domain-containing protein [Sulfitobacter geojensis]MBM1708237.1 Hint domain-containing protein [Sulfitobacter geojensis]MBM1712302.1 Hint domain-containing protein [Sulfitobacter geojensis]
MARSRPAPAQVLPVYRAEDFVASDGANMGDALSFASELVLDDIYELPFGTAPLRLGVLAGQDTHFRISSDSETGTPRATLVLDSALSFMSDDGGMHDALLMVEVDSDGNAAQIYLVPLTALRSGVEYRLVGIDTDTARQKFAQVACVSFTRGTHITLSSGEQRLIENLNIGDRVLTRDDGVQAVRWIGQTTVRAVGDFAPIKIGAGTLNNEHDLIVSPDHRLFIYQRSDEVGAGRAEILVKARHLVNGSSVTVMDGGFVDYFQLLFDSHQIVYAEGIAAETMLIDTRTKPVLPDELSASLGDVIPGHSDLPHAGLDVSEAMLDRPDMAALLRKASTR